MQEEGLEKEFQKYSKIGNHMPPQTADNMLIAYAFYKQALEGDNVHVRPNESSNVIQTFKHDSWKRLLGMPQNEAKRKYIDKIKELLKLTDQENRLPDSLKDV